MSEPIPDWPRGDWERRLLETFDHLEVDRLSAADLAAAAGCPPGTLGPVLAGLVASGCLRELAELYERTELGRLAVAGPLQLTLLSRLGCHLCEDTRRQIEKLLVGSSAGLRVVEVDSDRRLREHYGNDIPILFIGRREFARHQVESMLLRSELRRVMRGEVEGKQTQP